MIKEKAMKHGIRLELDTDDIPEITADERKLKQIMYNLLSNAVKFTPDGGKIRLSAHIANGRAMTRNKDASERNPKYIEIAVHDTGIGIKAQDLDRIFEPFEQIEKTVNPQDQGTGLGLSLTRRLVKLHGGKVWAQSQGVGQGSSFHIIIPHRQPGPG